jgi:hypothetical protein
MPIADISQGIPYLQKVNLNNKVLSKWQIKNHESGPLGMAGIFAKTESSLSTKFFS